MTETKHRFAVGDTVYVWWNDAPVGEYAIAELAGVGEQIGYKLDNGYTAGEYECFATKAAAEDSRGALA